jgi:hypothetical protein
MPQVKENIQDLDNLRNVLQDHRSKVSITDPDTLLDDSELRSYKQNVWVRYKLRFQIEQYTSDAVSRELDKRMRCVTSVWKVKSLQWQLLTTSKKRKLGDGLFTEEPELEESGPRGVEHYLDRLYTLMLAMPSLAPPE